MKHLRMLAVASLAAAAAVAALGDASASATVVCKVTEVPCSSANEWAAGTFMSGSLESGTSGIFETTGGAIEETCTGATISGTIENGGSGTSTPKGIAEKANLTWSGCTQAMETTQGGTIEIHHITGTDNGTVTASGFKTKVSLFGISCIYGYGNGLDIGTLTGGTKPTLDVNTVVNST